MKTLFRLILNYIQNHYIKVRRLSGGEFQFELKGRDDHHFWTCKPEYLICNIESAKMYFKIERVIYE